MCPCVANRQPWQCNLIKGEVLAKSVKYADLAGVIFLDIVDYKVLRKNKFLTSNFRDKLCSKPLEVMGMFGHLTIFETSQTGLELKSIATDRVWIY